MISGLNSRLKAKIINLKGDLILPIDRADKSSRSLLFSLFAYVIACSSERRYEVGRGRRWKEMGARITKVVVRNREKQKKIGS